MKILLCISRTAPGALLDLVAELIEARPSLVWEPELCYFLTLPAVSKTLENP